MKKLISIVLALGMAASPAARGRRGLDFQRIHGGVHGREHRGIYRSSRGQ